MVSNGVSGRRFSREGIGWAGLAIAALLLCGDCPCHASAPADSAREFGTFREACALGIDAGGAIIILDRGANQLLKYSPGGELIARTGSYGWGSDGFDRPADLTINNGLDIYVADYGNNRIRRFDRYLTPIDDVSLTDLDPPGGRPVSVTQTREGDLFVIDGENKQIFKFTAAAGVERTFGGIGNGLGNLREPRKIRVLGGSTIVVQDDSSLVFFDVYGNYLRRLPLQPFGAFRTFATLGDSLYVIDGTSLDVIGRSGEFRTVASLPLPPGETGLRDVAVLPERVLLLFSDRALIVPLAGQSDAR